FVLRPALRDGRFGRRELERLAFDDALELLARELEAIARLVDERLLLLERETGNQPAFGQAAMQIEVGQGELIGRFRVDERRSLRKPRVAQRRPLVGTPRDSRPPVRLGPSDTLLEVGTTQVKDHRARLDAGAGLRQDALDAAR